MVIVQATNPDVIPAVAEKSCNMWGVQAVNIGPLPELNTSIEVRKFHSDGQNITWSPIPEVVINIPNLFEEAAVNPRIAQIIELINEEIADRLGEEASIEGGSE